MSYFWENLSRWDTAIAFVDSESRLYSYAQIEQLISDTSEKIFRSERDLVFLYSQNNLHTVICYLSCLRAGNPVLLLDEDLDDGFKENLVAVYQPNLIIKTSPDGNLLAERSLDTVYDLDEKLAVLLSTSGSTGEPKLVKLSKDNIQSNAESIVTYLELQKTDRAISLLPFHYSYGLSILNSHLTCGASLVLTNDGIMSREFWNLFKTHEVSSISGVPYIYEILDKLRFNRMQLPSLRYMTQAGGKLSVQLVEQYVKQCAELNISFYVMYGQTEATARISYLHPAQAKTKPGSIGKAIPGGKLFLVSETGDAITKPGEHGELVYEGKNVMLGYAESLADFRPAMQSGTAPLKTLKTGDIAYFDEEGDFFIVGRSKRFLKIFGLRFGLDQMEKYLSDNGYSCICGGVDDRIEVAVLDEKIDLNKIKEFILLKYKINKNAIKLFYLIEVPRLGSGKIDYKSIFK